MLGTKILETKKSKHNGNLRVLRTWGMGTYIQSDGLTQSGGIVELIWRNTIDKVKGKGQEVKDVLILGLGGGTVAKLIRKNWLEAKITGVDIDLMMIELGKKYLELDTLKINIEIADALSFGKQLAINNKQFDLVIVDLYQGDQFPKKFESKNYIHLVSSLLASNGIAIFNRLYYTDKKHKDKKLEADEFGKKLQKVFKKVDFYRPPANLMFICYNI